LPRSSVADPSAAAADVITTRNAPHTRNMLVGAFVLSLVIHLFGGALWAHGNRLVARIMRRLPEQHQREEQVATSDVVHLERRTIPRPARASRAHSAPPPVQRQKQQKQSALVKPAVPRLAPSTPPEIAHRVHHAPARIHVATAARAAAGLAAARPRARSGLSRQRIAQLDAQFAQSIASSRVDLATIQKRSENRPVAQRPLPLQFTGMQANLERGEGYITPTTIGQRIGGTVWYYTHYTYMWPDGHLEDDDIPWPFHYPVQRDLFALHIHLIPLQLPPPGFRLTHPLKPFLAHFVQTRGQG
jgi:hypothetical protein